MKSKATSYELSKKLHEAGFECESHCGIYNNGIYENSSPTELDDILYKNLGVEIIKAYDCWDLLMWLSENVDDIPGHYQLWIWNNSFETIESSSSYKEQVGKHQKQPQNTLALAILNKIQDMQ